MEFLHLRNSTVEHVQQVPSPGNLVDIVSIAKNKNLLTGGIEKLFHEEEI